MERVSFIFHFRPDVDFYILIAVMAGQAAGAAWLLRGPASQASWGVRLTIVAGTLISFAALSFGFLLRFARVAKYFSNWWPSWGRGFTIIWAILSISWLAAAALSSLLSRIGAVHDPGRRKFLRAAQAGLFIAPTATLGYGVFIQRSRLRLREENLLFPGLPKDLDGLRLVQLTDIHLSPFLDPSMVEEAVGMANEARAHIAFVTGDLITTGLDPLDDCLRGLSQLRADAGVFGCMGNHEIYANAEAYVAERGARLGMRFLRSEAALLRFGNASLNLAGVDYQPFRKPYLTGAEKLIAPGAFNLLMSHNPDVFPVAARQGYDLTLAGHTHAGQVRVEILGADLNVARFFTPYVDGVYRSGSSSVFVSRGIGTIWLPARLGAPPEVALLHLCRT